MNTKNLKTDIIQRRHISKFCTHWGYIILLRKYNTLQIDRLTHSDSWVLSNELSISDLNYFVPSSCWSLFRILYHFIQMLHFFHIVARTLLPETLLLSESRNPGHHEVLTLLTGGHPFYYQWHLCHLKVSTVWDLYHFCLVLSYFSSHAAPTVLLQDSPERSL